MCCRSLLSTATATIIVIILPKERYAHGSTLEGFLCFGIIVPLNAILLVDSCKSCIILLVLMVLHCLFLDSYIKTYFF